MTTARDLRDCEQIARQNALDLMQHAPADDRRAFNHNLAVARGWLWIAQCHDDYAVELEQEAV